MNFSAVLDLLFPRLCILCDEKGENATDLCPRHETGPARLPSAICLRCGKEGTFPRRRCESCRTRTTPFSQAASALSYAGTGRELLLAWKLGGRREAMFPLLRACLALIESKRAGAMKRERWWGRIEAVTFVPLHRKKERERGFNQAEDLAREIARDMRWPLRPLLSRTRETPPQGRAVEANAIAEMAARRKNVEGAFVLRPTRRNPPRVVLLLDDVFTSGATAEECARVLRRGGSQRVLVLTALRGGGGMVSSTAS